MSIRSYMDHTKKIPSLVSLLTSIMFNDSFGSMKATFIRLINEIEQVGRALTYKKWELGHAYASYGFLNQHVFHSVLHSN